VKKKKDSKTPGKRTLRRSNAKKHEQYARVSTQGERKIKRKKKTRSWRERRRVITSKHFVRDDSVDKSAGLKINIRVGY